MIMMTMMTMMMKWLCKAYVTEHVILFVGANCWLKSEILRQGDVVHVEKCRTCQCPPVGHVVTYWRRVKGRHAVCRVDKRCQLNE